jgi:hypothetical protein
LTQKASNVRVQIRYGKTEEVFEGTVEQAWLALGRFFHAFVPQFDVAEKLLLNVDVAALARDCEGLVAFSPEGPNVLVPKNKLTDNEALALWLVAGYLGNKLNVLTGDAFSKEDLQMRLGKSSKITSTRLGELVKTGWATKTEEEKFRITTFGVAQMQRDVLPRIIAKIGV